MHAYTAPRSVPAEPLRCPSAHADVARCSSADGRRVRARAPSRASRGSRAAGRRVQVRVSQLCGTELDGLTLAQLEDLERLQVRR
jgi:hypothetical protein